MRAQVAEEEMPTVNPLETAEGVYMEVWVDGKLKTTEKDMQAKAANTGDGRWRRRHGEDEKCRGRRRSSENGE